MSVLARDSNGNVVYVIAPGVVQKITTSGTTAPSAAFGTNTTIIRICCTAAVHYTLGAAPVADATMTYLPANVVEYIGVVPGQKIAFIQDSAGGFAFVTEGA